MNLEQRQKMIEDEKIFLKNQLNEINQLIELKDKTDAHCDELKYSINQNTISLTAVLPAAHLPITACTRLSL